MRVTLFGCGSWGSRIARRLSTMPDVRLAVIDEDPERAQALGNELGCAWSFDPFGYLAVTGTQTSSVEGGAVVIATPPSTRLALVRAAMGGYGLPPTQVRIEKPLAETHDDALAIADACERAGAQLTVGFTLLHHPLYEAAFEFAKALGGVREVSGLRVGRPPRHDAHPSLDLAVHTASIAAYLDAPLGRLAVAHLEHADARRTVLVTPSGDVEVDELALRVRTPDGDIHIAADHDTLGRDLAAWLARTHRGTPEVAMRTQRYIAPCNILVGEERTCVA